MKRLVALLLALVLFCISLASCEIVVTNPSAKDEGKEENIGGGSPSGGSGGENSGEGDLVAGLQSILTEDESGYVIVRSLTPSIRDGKYIGENGSSYEFSEGQFTYRAQESGYILRGSYTIGLSNYDWRIYCTFEKAGPSEEELGAVESPYIIGGTAGMSFVRGAGYIKVDQTRYFREHNIEDPEEFNVWEKDIVIPEQLDGKPVLAIASGTFAGYCNLKSLEIPQSVTYIGEHAFSDCESLEEIVIPNSVNYIGGALFFGCDQLKTVCFDGTLEEWMAVEKDPSWKTALSCVIQCTDGVLDYTVDSDDDGIPDVLDHEGEDNLHNDQIVDLDDLTGGNSYDIEWEINGGSSDVVEEGAATPGDSSQNEDWDLLC